MRSAADNPLCHTGPQVQAQQCLQARSSPDQGQEGLLGEGQWWTEAQGEGPGEEARGAIGPEVRDQQPPGQVPWGKVLGLLVKSESRAAQTTPCRKRGVCGTRPWVSGTCEAGRGAAGGC